jgi:hypothetical protein
VRDSKVVIDMQIICLNVKTGVPINISKTRADQEQIPVELHTSQPQQKIHGHQI